MERLIFSDDAIVHISGEVNKSNIHIWKTYHSHAIIEYQSHFEKLTFFYAVSYNKVCFDEATVSGSSFLNRKLVVTQTGQQVIIYYNCAEYLPILQECMSVSKLCSSSVFDWMGITTFYCRHPICQFVHHMISFFGNLLCTSNANIHPAILQLDNAYGANHFNGHAT